MNLMGRKSMIVISKPGMRDFPIPLLVVKDPQSDAKFNAD